MHIDDDQRRTRLAHRHLLTPTSRAATALDVAEALTAVHSSDPVTVHLGLGQRMVSPTLDAIDTALYGGALIRHHAMRRTLWVMPVGVARLAHAGFTRKIAAAERARTAKLFGVDADTVDAAVERVVDVVERAGRPLSTREVGAAVPDLAAPQQVNQATNNPAVMAMHARALLLAAFEARLERGRPAGSWIGSQYAWVPHRAAGEMPGWASEPAVETGATEIVRRWLATFGPGTLADIVWWTGSTKTLVRHALTALDAVEVGLDGGGAGWVLPDDATTRDAPAGPWVAMLPALDPTAMGWTGREWYLDRAVAERVVDRNGNIGPTVWVDGRIAGGWAQQPDGGIVHDAGGLGAVHRELLDAEIDRLQRLVGDSRFTARFPSPNQRGLLARRGLGR